MIVFSTSLWCCRYDREEIQHIFYLHGKIVETQGINAISDRFGKYEYENIIDTLKSIGAVLHNKVRTEETVFQIFCEQTSIQIDELIASGVKPKNVTVIGASKGGVMAMSISHINKHPINYILLAANNEQIERENHWMLNGRILGIYDKSDALAGRDYQYWISQSINAIEFKQLEINTGLGHGFIYKPINDWWLPTKNWIDRKK